MLQSLDFWAADGSYVLLVWAMSFKKSFTRLLAVLLAELKQVLKQDLDLDLDVPKFLMIQRRRLCTCSFSKCSGGQSSASSQAWMLESPRRCYVSQRYPLAMMNGCSSLCRRRQLQSRSTWVSSTSYLTVSFTIRCCVSAKTRVLLFLGAILQHHSYPTSL